MISKTNFAELLDIMSKASDNEECLGVLGIDVSEFIEPYKVAIELLLGDELTEVMIAALNSCEDDEDDFDDDDDDDYYYDDDDYDDYDEDEEDYDDEEDDEEDDFFDEEEEEGFYLELFDPMDLAGSIQSVDNWMDAYDLIAKGYRVFM